MNTEQFDGHTPGPWVAKFDEHGVEGSLVVEGNRDDGGFGNFTASPLWVGESDENMPDARLIAAAPDLLATLIKTQKELAVYHQWASYVSAFVNSNASDEMYHYLECLMVEAGVWTGDEEE